MFDGSMMRRLIEATAGQGQLFYRLMNQLSIERFLPAWGTPQSWVSAYLQFSCISNLIDVFAFFLVLMM